MRPSFKFDYQLVSQAQRMSNDRDLLNQYPDLSDDEENNLDAEQRREQQPLPNSQPHKIVKTNETPETQKNSSFVAPKIFGGRNFTPPPPPPPPASGNNRRPGYGPPPPSSYPPPPSSYLPARSNHTPPRPVSNDSQGPRVERERKNCIFVKNIPKFYNEMDKLMTYFKNEGPVKDIKVNLEESSAVVRFVREESAIRFINSKKAVLNRECIICSFNEKEVVPPELIQKREDEETGKVKKLELDEKMMRENINYLLADKIRGMLFASKYVTVDEERETIDRELSKTIHLKKQLPKLNYNDLSSMTKTMTNEYDWTLSFKIPRDPEQEVEKRILINELQNKFGPVANLELQPRPEDYLVKVTFLGPKHSWQVFWEYREQNLDIEVEGATLKRLFSQGIIKPTTKQAAFMALIANAQRYQQPQQEENQQGLIEILPDGDLREVQPTPVSEAQVDQLLSLVQGPLLYPIPPQPTQPQQSQALDEKHQDQRQQQPIKVQEDIRQDDGDQKELDDKGKQGEKGEKGEEKGRIEGQAEGQEEEKEEKADQP